MSDRAQDVCRRAHELTSAFLDGRLDAARRGALQRHLQRCGACLQNLRETERLARAAHNLPRHRHAAGLGARVHAAAQQRRQDRVAALGEDPPSRGDRGLRWLLVASLLCLAWSIGYHMGADRPAAGDAAAAGSDPTFAATSRRVLGDLTIAADLPARQRRPLLQSQLELFDLRARARRALAAAAPRSAERALAALVLDLGDALEQDEVDWGGLRERAPLPRQEPPLPAAEPPRAQPLQAVLARHGGDLDPTERGELEQFLQLKRRLVSGEHVTAQEFHWTSADGTASVSGFSIASGFAGVRSMVEAGDLEQADALRRRMQDTLRALHRAPQREQR